MPDEAAASAAEGSPIGIAELSTSLLENAHDPSSDVKASGQFAQKLSDTLRKLNGALGIAAFLVCSVGILQSRFSLTTSETRVNKIQLLLGYELEVWLLLAVMGVWVTSCKPRPSKPLHVLWPVSSIVVFVVWIGFSVCDLSHQKMMKARPTREVRNAHVGVEARQSLPWRCSS